MQPLREGFKFLFPLTIRWLFFQFLAKFVKNLYHKHILFKFTNIRYLHLVMCLPHANDNKAVGNSAFKAFK